MKKTIILILAMACLIAGCSQIDPLQQVNEGGCLVSFNLVGEIAASVTPMTKASTNDIYLVQVYQGSDPFASGVYDNINDIRINLKRGSAKYRIVISMIRNGKIQLANRYGSANNSLKLKSLKRNNPNNGYVNIQNTYNGTLSWSDCAELETCFCINTCYYNSVRAWYFYRSTGDATLQYGNPTNSYGTSSCGMNNRFEYNQYADINEKYGQCDDWFYGEINDYSPTGEYETLNLDLKRVGFKLKYELSGVTDGEVTVKVYNSTKTFIDNTTSTVTYSSEPVFYAFYEARNAWLYSDEYMENMTLEVSWKRGIGVTEDYGTKTIQIKRNCLNNIKIQMTSADQNAGMHLTVEAESTIGAEAVTIPVQ